MNSILNKNLNANLVEMLILPIAKPKHSVLKVLKPLPSLLSLNPQSHIKKRKRLPSNLALDNPDLKSFILPPEKKKKKKKKKRKRHNRVYL
jgi:hypothetical protein